MWNETETSYLNTILTLKSNLAKQFDMLCHNIWQK